MTSVVFLYAPFAPQKEYLNLILAFKPKGLFGIH